MRIRPLKINSDLVGTTLKPFTTEVNWRNMMNYAAGIGDNNPVYFNDELEEGIVAMPMFAVATSWKLVENLTDYIKSDNFPSEVFFTSIHYSEHLKIHRLIKHGDKLSFTGKITAILPHRAGTHIVLKLSVTDQHNKPVFTEYHGGMLRGVECLGPAQGKDELPLLHKFKSQVNENNNIWEQPIEIHPLSSYLYDAGSDIHFPIHTSQQFAKQMGLPGIILQGTATLAYTIKEIINTEAQGDPFKIKEIACNFTRMVLPGSTLSCILLQKESDNQGLHLGFHVLGPDKQKVLSNGYVHLA